MIKYLPFCLGLLCALVILSCSSDDNGSVSPNPGETVVVVNFSQPTGFDNELLGGNLPVLILSGVVENPSSITITSNDIEATSGQDYNFDSPQVVEIPTGSYDGTVLTAITIPGLSILDDTLEEGFETFELVLSAPTGDAVLGNQIRSVYTINDDESILVAFSQETATDQERDGGNLPLVLVTGTITEIIEVTVTVVGNGTATLDEDYTIQSPATISIPPGSYDGSIGSGFTVPGLTILDDLILEPTEFFELTLEVDAESALVGVANTRYEIGGFIPCENGMAGNNPCDGFDLIAQLNLSVFSAAAGNDIWGWTDPDNAREYALVGLDNGTAFVDVSDDEPIYLGKLPSATGSSVWRDIKVYGNYAFIVSEAAGHGMQVFDLTQLRNVVNPPQTFSANARYTDIGNAHNVVINEATAFAYPVGTARNDAFRGGVHFVDIQNPLVPTGVGGYGINGYTHDAQVITYNGPDPDYQGREIFIGSNENLIAVVDITDKSNPTEITTLSYSNLGYTHQGWFTEDQRYFLLGDELDEINFGFNSRTLVFDMTDLDNPTLHMEYSGTTSAIDHNGYVLGDAFFLANYTAGIRVLDISNIGGGTITETSFFDTYPQNDTPSFDGVWSVYPYFASEKIIVNDINSGLFIIKQSE